MKKFIVKGYVKYNGKSYTSGQVVAVDDKDAKEFEKFGWQVVSRNVESDKPVSVEVLPQQVVQQEPPQQPAHDYVVPATDYSVMTTSQLKEILTKKGIEFNKSANKKKLVELLVKKG